MKILATLDRTDFSKAILPLLTKMADLPDAELILLSVARAPKVKPAHRGIPRPVVANDAMGRGMRVMVKPPEPVFPENKGQAIVRRIEEVRSYLSEVVHELPAGTNVRIEAHVSDAVGDTIIERARSEQVDVIVMATHSRSNLAQALFGSVTEQVVRSGVAPVLLVHPE